MTALSPCPPKRREESIWDDYCEADKKETLDYVWEAVRERKVMGCFDQAYAIHAVIDDWEYLGPQRDWWRTAAQEALKYPVLHRANCDEPYDHCTCGLTELRRRVEESK